MKYSIVLPLLVESALAFPSVLESLGNTSFDKRQGGAPNATAAFSQAEGNCGPRPCLVFNAEDQYVSTTGQHAYRDPSPGDRRGPCPGLNAAANHGYLPRSGVASISDTVDGLFAAFAMSPELSGFLAAYAIIMTGDPILQKWSIGGPFEQASITDGLLRAPQGISYSHNKYEGDTSLTRPDAYLNNGDASSLDLRRFRRAYEACTNNRCTLDKFRVVHSGQQYDSIRENPYYFAPLFSTTLVVPAAHNFIINFMSNHSAEEPNGFLDREVFKAFFAVSGTYPNFRYNKGKERIPDNWYRRPSVNAYGDVDTVSDLVIGWSAYPSTFRFGGNTGGVNTYTGIDLADISGGLYNSENILEGNNFACLFFQTQQQAIPDALKGLVNDVAGSLSLLNRYTGWFRSLNCPQLARYDNSIFDRYPGRTYNPNAPNSS